jgi:hypothetical protein
VQLSDYIQPALGIHDKSVLATGALGVSDIFFHDHGGALQTRTLLIFSPEKPKRSDLAVEFLAERYPLARQFIGH